MDRENYYSPYKNRKTSPAECFGVHVAFINLGGKISTLYTCILLDKKYICQCMEYMGNCEFRFFYQGELETILGSKKVGKTEHRSL